MACFLKREGGRPGSRAAFPPAFCPGFWPGGPLRQPSPRKGRRQRPAAGWLFGLAASSAGSVAAKASSPRRADPAPAFALFDSRFRCGASKRGEKRRGKTALFLEGFRRLALLAFLAAAMPQAAAAAKAAKGKTVKYKLTAEKRPRNLSGKKTVPWALSLNGSIPAPVLEFTEGDFAEIQVTNKIPGETLSIHWHGILLDPEMDGVPYLTTPPIFYGKSHVFRFKIRQHGTYWYHSHTSLQEQRGLYGAIVIHPRRARIFYDKEAAVVLSDWSDEKAGQIMKNLRKDGEYYRYKKDSVRSWLDAIREGALGGFLLGEWTRMGGMDLSDVGYDAFLMNGKKSSQLLKAKKGETIRLRLINAGASTYFYVSLSGLPMKVISADGMDIQPVKAKELLLGMGETYDLLFKLPEKKNYELRATAQDVTGYASAWIGGGEPAPAPDKPKPGLYMDSSGGHKMHGGGHGGRKKHGHSGHSSRRKARGGGKGHAGHAGHGAHSMESHARHKAPPEPAPHRHPDSLSKKSSPKKSSHSGGPPSIEPMKVTAGFLPFVRGAAAHQKEILSGMARGPASNRPGHKANSGPHHQAAGGGLQLLTVDHIRSLKKTAFPVRIPRYDLRLVLGGDMERYVWHINGKALHQDQTIKIKKGDVIRFAFENETMMHHPMHLHGHFFRVLGRGGELSPLKHTVDVPPHGKRVIEFLANEPGEWLLHCHNLYHMKTGMTRIIRYSGFSPKPETAKWQSKNPMLKDSLYFSGELELATNQAALSLRLSQTWDSLEAELEAHSYTHLAGARADLFYRRWFGRFFSLIAGGALRAAEESGKADSRLKNKVRGVLGAGYILPMLVEASVFIDHKGKFRLDLEKRFQWTKHLFSEAEAIFWQGEKPDLELSLMYARSPVWALGLTLTEESYGFGGGLSF